MKIEYILSSQIILIAIGKTVGYDFNPILIVDQGTNVMIELSSKHPYCNIQTDRHRIRINLRMADVSKVYRVPETDIMKYVEICKNKTANANLQNIFSFPGTKWCGPGDTAKSNRELGVFFQEDECCREHDSCSRYIDTGVCRGGVCNDSPYTRSHCECDNKFKTCLQNLRSPVGNLIGEIFFNVIGMTCFKEVPPCNVEDPKTRLTITQEYITSYFNVGGLNCSLEFKTTSQFKPKKPYKHSILLSIKRKHLLIIQTLFRKN
ncbi:uncharacterized protein LOC115885038 [Sitophilus oryzae]|uniref:phospholipase A2 n=1 Tax=Sitophilus oryzae TaxID=7048 RepID=A0A6J2Y8Z5_SITOR|nr:uncharacterized protein LOC115885038 [Sitophilus oryzae]XP_030759648.1 uncharacterized protein LOC115885038 [Sitophilus oryzae]XP_030759649.1 uncharacterized protein LOC115885038 [Sitophilus oryzae]XP_030759650.1 uncharacterized protein LOC115885038 [Sitophilus oryzae]